MSEAKKDKSDLSALLCDDEALCKWLRDNSSGNYRASALAAERIEQLLRQVGKRNKVINYCINQIQDSSKLKYIGTMTREMDT